MFERYAPIQRAVKPKVWKQAIDRAIALKPTQWPTMPAPEQDENGVVNAAPIHAAVATAPSGAL